MFVKMNKLKNNSGITLIALSVTIIVLLILVSISASAGTKIISKSKAQTIETNMLTIEAKAKAYAEEIDAKIWVYKNDADYEDKRNSAFAEKNINIYSESLSEEIQGQISNEILNNSIIYTVTGSALTDMGLKDLSNETYLIIFNGDNYKSMDIIYPVGISYNGTTYYSLSSLKEALEN